MWNTYQHLRWEAPWVPRGVIRDRSLIIFVTIGRRTGAHLNFTILFWYRRLLRKQGFCGLCNFSYLQGIKLLKHIYHDLRQIPQGKFNFDKGFVLKWCWNWKNLKCWNFKLLRNLERKLSSTRWPKITTFEIKLLSRFIGIHGSEQQHTP